MADSGGTMKIITIITICIMIITIGLSGCLEDGGEGDSFENEYNKNINRNYTNEIERKILNIAETSNYSKILSTDRYDHGMNITYSKYSNIKYFSNQLDQ